jgi:hypothetical protein
MKENEMGGVCSTDEIEEESTEGLVGNLKEINCLEDLCMDGKMILKWILRGLRGHRLDSSEGQVASSCKHRQRAYNFLKRDCDSQS